MRYALILAGGSGVRLWPMSRACQPKQLIPFIAGRCLLQVAADRLQGLIDPSRSYICAAQSQRDLILDRLPAWDPSRLLSEPLGRDTLNAVGFSAAILALEDPDAVISVFTADHLIEPVDAFQRIVNQAFELVEAAPETLVTFGVAPTHPATGYGYLELAEPLPGGARRVARFQEKPAAAVAETYFQAGPSAYLWNSGMFVWRASTLLDCIRRYEPETHAALLEIAAAWRTPHRDEVLFRVYPTLKKISIDFAVMEPASADPAVRVAAVPMPLSWLDVGSWPSFAETRPADDQGNRTAARAVFRGARNNLVASSEPNHLLSLVGCEDLLVIHTADATLVCRRCDAESIKQLHSELPPEYL